MTSDPVLPTVTPTNQIKIDLAAFDRTAAARAALPRESLVRFTLEPMYSTGKAMQIAERLAAFRAEIAALPGFDIVHLDQLDDVARGLRWVHTEALRRVQSLRALPELAKEGYRLRTGMMAFLEFQAFERKVDPAMIERLKEGSGYRDLAEDLNVIGHELIALKAVEEGKIKEVDLARSAEIANAIQRGMGLTEVDLPQEALVEARQKLGTILLRSHGQLRRAMEYLRYDQGDAAELVPSLYVPAGRGGKPVEPDPLAELSAVHDHLHEDPAAPVPPKDPNDNPFGA